VVQLDMARDMTWMMKWGFRDIQVLTRWSVVDRKSEKQIFVALSTTDVEYIAANVTGHEVMWI